MKKGDVLGYAYEGYSTMMFVDETDENGFFYWSVRLVIGTDIAEVIPSRQYMCEMLEKALEWTPARKEIAAMSLIVLADQSVKQLESLMESLQALNRKDPSPENFRELVALGMEINLHTERHHALGKMGEIIFGEEEPKRAHTSNWIT